MKSLIPSLGYISAACSSLIANFHQEPTGGEALHRTLEIPRWNAIHRSTRARNCSGGPIHKQYAAKEMTLWIACW